ncbi:hypothetical protein O3P69_015015, partial [Scylla paramamosain]
HHSHLSKGRRWTRTSRRSTPPPPPPPPVRTTSTVWRIGGNVAPDSKLENPRQIDLWMSGVALLESGGVDPHSLIKQQQWQQSLLPRGGSIRMHLRVLIGCRRRYVTDSM